MHYTIVLSGPARTLADAEVALDLANVPVLPADHHAHMGLANTLPPLASGKKPRAKHAFLTVQHADINVPTDLVEPHGWVLRAYYPTPEPLTTMSDPDENRTVKDLAATVAEMQREIAALKRQKAGV